MRTYTRKEVDSCLKLVLAFALPALILPIFVRHGALATLVLSSALGIPSMTSGGRTCHLTRLLKPDRSTIAISSTSMKWRSFSMRDLGWIINDNGGDATPALDTHNLTGRAVDWDEEDYWLTFDSMHQPDAY